eukprot:m.63141 g.63141  ORF g.63141 m.63141 type:complete len:51 (+) comp13425_c0_seq3:175-327(+)
MAAPASLSEELCAQVEAFMQETKEEHAIICELVEIFTWAVCITNDEHQPM